MRIGVIAPGSVLGKAVIDQLSAHSQIITFGRSGADIPFEIGLKNEFVADTTPVDVIINCAANFGGSKLLDWREAAIVNAVGATDVLQLAESARASQVMNISSISSIPENVDEDLTGYGLSKRQGEEWFALGARRAGIIVLNLRLGAFYTDDSAGSRHQPFLYALMAKAAVGEEFVLGGENDPVRNYLHVDDVVAALQHAASAARGPPCACRAAVPSLYRIDPSRISDIRAKGAA